MAESTTATATFVFTDVEGSTDLLRAQGRERYTELLESHARSLRAVFEARHGVDIDTQDDAFFFAFRSAADAVAAAVEAQTALAIHDWPDGAAVRVRMGIHTGEATLTDGRYVGFAVHRAARIAAAAHGG